MVLALLQTLAASGPKFELSPETSRKTCLGDPSWQELSPNSREKRKNALDEPSKKGLKAYEKLMQSHEAAVKKGVQELDKATQEFMTMTEKKAEMNKKAAARLERKRKDIDEMAAESRRTACTGVGVLRFFSFL